MGCAHRTYIAIAQMVDFYLDDARAVERAHIVELVARDDAEATELLYGYIREGQSKCLPINS